MIQQGCLKTLAAVLVIFFALLFGKEREQPIQPALACLGEFHDARIERDGLQDMIPPEDIPSWQGILGQSVWVGYEQGGFDIPDDTADYFTIYAVGEAGNEVQIWVWEAPSTPDWLYVLPFNNTTPYSDANGEHFGVHPCGAFRVNAFDVYLLLSRYAGFY